MQKHNKNRFAATALSALMAFGSLGSLPALAVSAPPTADRIIDLSNSEQSFSISAARST